MRILAPALLVLACGCALVRSPADRAAKNRVGSDSKSWLGSLATSAGDELEIGQYCQFDFTEDDAKSTLAGFMIPRHKTKIGGRVVSIDSDHVLLTEVVEIVDSASSDAKSDSRPVRRPLSADPNKEFKFPLRKMAHVRTAGAGTAEQVSR